MDHSNEIKLSYRSYLPFRALPSELLHKILLHLISPRPWRDELEFVVIRTDAYEEQEDERKANCLALLQTCKKFYLIARPLLWYHVSIVDSFHRSAKIAMPVESDMSWPDKKLKVRNSTLYDSEMQRVTIDYNNARSEWASRRRLDLAFRAPPCLSNGTVVDGVLGDAVRVLDLGACHFLSEKGFERIFKTLRNLKIILYPTSSIEMPISMFSGWQFFDAALPGHPLLPLLRNTSLEFLSVGWTRTPTDFTNCFKYLSQLQSAEHLELAESFLRRDANRDTQKSFCIHLLTVISSWTHSLRALTLSKGFPAISELIVGLTTAAPLLEVLDYWWNDELFDPEDTNLDDIAANLIRLQRLKSISFLWESPMDNVIGTLDPLYTELPLARHICTSTDLVSPALFSKPPSASLQSVIFNFGEDSYTHAQLRNEPSLSEQLIKVQTGNNDIQRYWRMIAEADDIPWHTVPQYMPHAYFRVHAQKMYKVGLLWQSGLNHITCADDNCRCKNVILFNESSFSDCEDDQY